MKGGVMIYRRPAQGDEWSTPAYAVRVYWNETNKAVVVSFTTVNGAGESEWRLTLPAAELPEKLFTTVRASERERADADHRRVIEAAIDLLEGLK